MENPNANVLGQRTIVSGAGISSVPTPAANLALPVGYRLFEYRIDTVLGQGGFGIAYKATDVNLAAKVVVKEHFPEAFARRAADLSVEPRDDTEREVYTSGRESFLSEARTLASFRHPP